MKNKTKQRILYFCICLLFLAEACISSAKVYYSAVILDKAQAGDLSGMLFSIFLAVSACLGLFLVDYLNTRSKLAYMTSIELEIKHNIVHAMLHRPMQAFREKDDAYYFNLLTTDVDTYRNDFIGSRLMLISWVFYGISAAAMLCKLHPMLLLAGLVLAIIPIFTNNLFTAISQKAKNGFSGASEAYSGALQELIKGYETIRANNAAAFAEDRHDFFSTAKRRAASRYSFVQNMSMEAFYTFAGLNALLGIGVGGYLVIQGKLSAVLMLAAQSYFVTLGNAFSNISNYVVEMRAAGDIRKKLRAESVRAPEVGEHLTSPGDIRYDRVSLRFGEKTLYRNFSETFPAGKATAIVGESGCGKSTLIKLLLRYYAPDGGKITIGEQDVQTVSEETLYRRIGLVEQSPFLFNATLYENITLFSGAPKEDSEEYRHLLRALNLEKLAEQVGDQKLGDFGEKISGGERQRINLARVARQKKPIVIYDEPTTGLDPENTRLIDQFIFAQTGTTRIVITHDHSPDFLGQFDKVVRL